MVRPVQRAVLTLLPLLLLAAVLPSVPADRHGGECDASDPTCGVKVPDHCTKPGTAWAGITNVEAAGVTLQTQAGGTTLALPRGLLALAASTTGTLDVKVEHRCVMWYTFSWTKTDTLGQTTGGSTTVYPLCNGGGDLHQIPIGNDVVQVQMTLFWSGCDGTTGQDGRDVKVVDPALGI